MTVKTEQLKHALKDLEGHVKKLNEFPRDSPANTIIAVRELVSEINDSILDCLAITFSILSEGE